MFAWVTDVSMKSVSFKECLEKPAELKKVFLIWVRSSKLSLNGLSGLKNILQSFSKTGSTIKGGVHISWHQETSRATSE